jgi:hypothetical protein
MVKLSARINELTGQPGFTLPGTANDVATMAACAVLVLDKDALLAAAALHHAQQTVLAAAKERGVKDPSNRALFGQYSLLVSGLRRKDMLLGKEQQ